MAPCTGSTITPKMIRTGKMKIGDRIELEDIVASSPEFSLQPRQNVRSEDFAASEPVGSPAAAPVGSPAAATVSSPESTPAEPGPQEVSQSQPSSDSGDVLVQGPAPSMQPSQNRPWNSSQNNNISAPLTYDQMTPYLDHSAVNTQGSQPYVTIPQTPMTTLEFTETIDMTDVQSYLGFLRTQIGRYMRIEQLMGSNQVEARYGFLVGVGSNFIVLQEITSGNIMVVDLFTIRLTYIYYSDPVVPPGVQQ